MIEYLLSHDDAYVVPLSDVDEIIPETGKTALMCAYVVLTVTL